MQRNKQKNSELGLVASFQRQIKPGNRFNKLFPKPDFSDTLLQEGNVNDTVQLMGQYIQKYKPDTSKLAPILKGNSLEETLRNNWNFVYNHIQYKLDTPGVEELRRPARSWAERKSGVDCDCYTIFLCTLLLNQGIEPVIRIVQIPPATSFHHVYPIVYKKGNSGEYYTLDAVLERFNYEKPFSKKRDYTMDELGIPIKGLHGIPQNNKLTCLSNFCNDNLGSSDDPVYARLVATRDIIAEYPASIAPFEDPKRFLKELNYAIDNWHTANRDQALRILAQREKQLDDVEPLSGLTSEMGDDLEHMTDDQVEAMVDLLSGTYNNLDKIETGEDLGRVLIEKDKRLQEKQHKLSRKLKSTRRNHPSLSRRIKSIARLRQKINQVNKLDNQGKSKLVRVIKQTYHAKPKIQEERVDEPLRHLPKTNILPIERNIPDLRQPDQDFIYQEDFSENYQVPEINYSEPATEYIDISPVEEKRDTYQDDPYDEWLELVEDYLDDMEDLEDEITLLELSQLSGLGSVQLGAFWHKRKKRLELKHKRQEKRLKKAEKAGQANRVKQLTVRLDKNKIKQQQPAKWRKVRSQWRKDNKRGFWQGIQKTGQGAINALVRYNPLSIAARNGFLAALKLNIKKISSRLKWGYASKDQALKHGMSLERWQKSKQALSKVENLFVNKTKGSKTALRSAILKGGKGLSGFGLEGLGAAQFAAVAAAATPLIIAAVKILQQTGIMDPSVKVEKVEEDIKKGDFENSTDVPSSEFDDVELDIEKPWYRHKGIKIAGIAGGGLLLLGLGYRAMSRPRNQTPGAGPKPQNQLSGESQRQAKKPKRSPHKESSTKKEPIKEITLT